MIKQSMTTACYILFNYYLKVLTSGFYAYGEIISFTSINLTP